MKRKRYFTNHPLWGWGGENKIYGNGMFHNNKSYPSGTWQQQQEQDQSMMRVTNDAGNFLVLLHRTSLFGGTTGLPAPCLRICPSVMDPSSTNSTRILDSSTSIPSYPYPRHSMISLWTSCLGGFCVTPGKEHHGQQHHLLDQPTISSPHLSAITCMDIDNHCSGNGAGRYLLAGSRDATMSLYDLETIEYLTNEEQEAMEELQQEEGNSLKGKFGERKKILHQTRMKPKPIRPLHRSRKQVRGSRRVPTSPHDTFGNSAPVAIGHGSSITGLQWYTYDNGMFLSCGLDGNVYVWDTNTFEIAYRFALSYIPGGSSTNSMVGSSPSQQQQQQTARQPVNALAMPRYDITPSPFIGSATTLPQHGLAAAGISHRIVLCDVTSGASTHTLIGHSSDITSLQWCPGNSHELCSSSYDGTIRLWDIRQSGSRACIHIFDSISGSKDNSNLDERTISDDTVVAQHFQAHETTKRESSSNKALGPNAYAHLQRASYHISSHGVGGSNTITSTRTIGITSIQYSPKDGGQSIVSVGTDGKILVWNRRDHSKMKSVSRRRRLNNISSAITTDHQSTVSYEALPVNYLGEGTQIRGPGRKESKTPMLVTQELSHRSQGSRLWVGSGFGANNNILGYDVLHQEGGRPHRILRGHLSQVTCLASQSIGTSNGVTRLWSGSEDGMILGWGSSFEAKSYNQKILTRDDGTSFPSFQPSTTFKSNATKGKNGLVDEDWWDL